jgi:hypothetical protein
MSRIRKLFDGLNEDYEHIANKRQRMLAIKADPFYNALQIKFAYAVTCHKAQGVVNGMPFLPIRATLQKK